MNGSCSLKRLASAAFLFASGSISAGLSIAGGNDVANTKSAVFFSLDGDVTPISLSPGVSLSVVAINDSNQAIVAGTGPGTTFYAATASPTAAATATSSTGTPGFFVAAAINASGQGVIGGEELSSLLAYAARVSFGSSVEMPILIPVGIGGIGGAAIISSGEVLIGGSIAGPGPYAALIPPGSVTPTAIPLGMASGGASAVALNEASVGLIGGQNDLVQIYAARITSGSATTITLSPTGTGTIEAVSINALGQGIIGGKNNGFADGYAALIPSSGTASTTLSLGFGAGSINSVSINDSGQAIIGGQNGTAPFAALVSPSGVVAPISLGFSSGAISGVSINNLGVAAIAGTNSGSSSPYLAIVSPSGVATPLNLGVVLGSYTSVEVRIPTAAALNALTPSTVGPSFGGPMITSLLASSRALAGHVDLFHKWGNRRSSSNPMLGLLTQSEVSMSLLKSRQAADQSLNVHYPQASSSAPYSLWFAPFYDYIDQAAQSSFPASNMQVAGAVLGFDYWASNRLVLGGGAAYAYNYVHVDQSLGHSSINEAMLTYFTSYKSDRLFINASVWGGYYQLNSDRHTLGMVTSKSDTRGWLFNPHLELCGANYAKQSERLFIEVFAMVDWVNNWQEGYTEQGRSGFNLTLPSLHNSLVRSEAGMTFYQTFAPAKGRIFLRERGSFINKTPFGFNPATTAFVGSLSTFTIATGSNKMQNLGGVQLFASWVPDSEKAPYWQLGFSGEFSRSYQSYFSTAELGKNF